MTGGDVQVLVVGEDGECFAEAVLKAEGWAVTSATTDDALDSLQRQQPDVVVLQLERFGVGLELCRAVRTRSRVPVMLVSRSSAEDDIVAGLRCGADALVVEGIGPREFVARLRALLRRAPRTSPREPVDTIAVGPLLLNRAKREVSIDGRQVTLPRREFDILEMLMRDVDRTVTRAALRRQLWGASRDSRTIDVQVRRLRRRLAAVEGGRRIVTVRGVGYRFTSELVPPTPDDVDLEIDLTEPSDAVAAESPPVDVRPS